MSSSGVTRKASRVKHGQGWMIGRAVQQLGLCVDAGEMHSHGINSLQRLPLPTNVVVVCIAEIIYAKIAS